MERGKRFDVCVLHEIACIFRIFCISKSSGIELIHENESVSLKPKRSVSGAF
jgi:hypothetical protein